MRNNLLWSTQKLAVKLIIYFSLKFKIVLAHSVLRMHLVTHFLVQPAFGHLKVMRASWTL